MKKNVKNNKKNVRPQQLVEPNIYAQMKVVGGKTTKEVLSYSVEMVVNRVKQRTYGIKSITAARRERSRLMKLRG
jgi:hypothetical protein